jgi:hypothetical protein
MHYQPEGPFQQSVLGKFKEESDAIMKSVQREHERHMERLEQDSVASQKFWQDKDRELRNKFQVCNGEWFWSYISTLMTPLLGEWTRDGSSAPRSAAGASQQ